MSREHRFDAEQRLKEGKLRALVATASLELGIDVGSIDLVCQIGTPKSIAAFLQRAGRAGHQVHATPKARIFPLTRDELVEISALLDALYRGELDELIIPEKPLDILAQQIVAEVSAKEYSEDELYQWVKSAWPYRNLERGEFTEILRMLAEGYATRNGRRSAYVHHDMVNARVRPRKNARLTALMSGGAIPDLFDYDVILEPSGNFIGTLNEDFAIESLPGDIFQLGNNSWQILRVENSKVRVQDAGGLPPTIPFWLGEAPGRTRELSEAVSRLRKDISDRLPDLDLIPSDEEDQTGEWKKEVVDWVAAKRGMDRNAADQLVTYLATAEAAIGAMPTREHIIMERFFDEAGDMHLVIHAPFGSRLNRGWGLALRKRFCRKFNFELQAAATEDAIILSLGSTHSFPIEEVFQYLNPKTVRDVLIQALLDAPMFEIRWRWNASRALAILRRRAGQRVPPQIQRMQSEDLVALVFPDQLACLENIAGDREVPDHPLVRQTIHDCLTEAMDIDELEELLQAIASKSLKMTGVDLREPSALAQEIINARPYAFLDDAPLEERRTNAVQNRRWLDPASARDLGRLDPAAIRSVRLEAWPRVSDTDELHDALSLYGFFTLDEVLQYGWQLFTDELIEQKRATVLSTATGGQLLVALERLGQVREIHPEAIAQPPLDIPERIAEAYGLKAEGRERSLVEIVRGRLECMGPVHVTRLADLLSVAPAEIESTLLHLENEGFVFRGQFTGEVNGTEWCERRLLARINRYTIRTLRKEIEAVSSADFMRFLFSWHRMLDDQPEGGESLKDVIGQLEGYEAAAQSWEGDLLPGRLKNYDPAWLDQLCLTGRVQWCRFSKGQSNASPVRNTPIGIVSRANMHIWQTMAIRDEEEASLAHYGMVVREALQRTGALFFDDIVTRSGLLPIQVEEGIGELVSAGMITADSYTGLRALLSTPKGRRRKQPFRMEEAGRWSLLAPPREAKDIHEAQEQLFIIARILLKRYGVVFRKIMERERNLPPWRELLRAYRTLEARGEIRGGHFVEGVYGEQFALPEAVTRLRAVRRKQPENELVSIAATDPLNLTAIITPGKRVASIGAHRVLYRNGIPIACKEGADIHYMVDIDPAEEWNLRNMLIQRKITPALRAYL